MPRLILVLTVFLYVGCLNKVEESNHVFKIYNCILNHEIQLIRTCVQEYDDSLSYDKIPEGIFIQSFPPFDSLPCILSINGNIQLENEYLHKRCIVLKLNSALNFKSPLINPITYERARTFLGSLKEIEIPINLSEFDIKKSGVEVTKDVKNCENQFSDIYNFSSMLLNDENDRAVVFCHIQSHSEQKIAYFLRRLGEVWYLEIKEHM